MLEDTLKGSPKSLIEPEEITRHIFLVAHRFKPPGLGQGARRQIQPHRTRPVSGQQAHIMPIATTRYQHPPAKRRLRQKLSQRRCAITLIPRNILLPITTVPILRRRLFIFHGFNQNKLPRVGKTQFDVSPCLPPEVILEVKSRSTGGSRPLKINPKPFTDSAKPPALQRSEEIAGDLIKVVMHVSVFIIVAKITHKQMYSKPFFQKNALFFDFRPSALIINNLATISTINTQNPTSKLKTTTKITILNTPFKVRRQLGSPLLRRPLYPLNSQ